MKCKKNNILLLGLLLCSFYAAPVFANEISAENSAETSMMIDIVEGPIRISQVTVPTFGTYYRSSNAQNIKATGDLIIDVKDERDNKDSPWTLTYQVATFANGKEYSVKVNIGEGQATAKEDGSSMKATPKKIAGSSNETNSILEAYSSDKTDYRYRVAKEDISLDLPAGLPSGNFVGKEIVTLLNTPEAN